MTSIVAGQNLGLFNTSANVLGGQGQIGTAAQGRSGEKVAVNAATGNLVVQQQDEWLVGVGPDVGIMRTYNSLATSDGDNGDNWRLGLNRKIIATGTGVASIQRIAEDGAELTYSNTAGKFINKDGAGSYDAITWDSTNSQWVWEDGDTGTKEYYKASGTANEYRLVQIKDADNNSVTLAYDATSGLLKTVTSANNEKVVLTYETGSSRLQSIEVQNSNSGLLAKRVTYEYDPQGRLKQVNVDLSTNTNDADTSSYWTKYEYVDTASRKIKAIKQSDDSSLEILYDGNGRVQWLNETMTAGTDVRQTQFEYLSATKARITDASGQKTELTFDANQQLLSIKRPMVGSLEAPTVTFTYDVHGNVETVRDERGNLTRYGYDTATGNRILEQDAQGNVVTRTFNSANQVLSETRYSQRDTDDSGPLGVSGGETTHYIYDDTKPTQLRYVVSPEGRVTRYEYNPLGQRSSTAQFNDSDVFSTFTPLSQDFTSDTTGLASTTGFVRNTTTRRLEYTASTATSSAKIASSTTGAMGTLWRAEVTTPAGASPAVIGENLLFMGLESGTEGQASYHRLRVRLSNGQILTESQLGTSSNAPVLFGAAKAGTTYVIEFDTNASGSIQLYIYEKGLDRSQVTPVNHAGDGNWGTPKLYIQGNSGPNAVAGTVAIDNLLAQRRPTLGELNSWVTGLADKSNVALTTYVYDARGQLSSQTTYGNTTGSAGTAVSGATPSWNDESWAKVTVNYVYDQSGNLKQKFEFTKQQGLFLSNNSWALEQRRLFGIVYGENDPNGTKGEPKRAAHLTDDDQIILSNKGTYRTDYLYDGLNRLTKQVDANGDAVNTTYLDTERGIKIEYANGLTSMSTYDRAGRLTYQNQYATDAPATSLGATSYTYDKMGRLTSTTVGTSGPRSYILYDTLGRKSGVIDAEGALMEYRYNDAGQVTATIGYANKVSTAVLETLAADPAKYGMPENLANLGAYGASNWTLQPTGNAKLSSGMSTADAATGNKPLLKDDNTLWLKQNGTDTALSSKLQSDAILLPTTGSRRFEVSAYLGAVNATATLVVQFFNTTNPADTATPSGTVTIGSTTGTKAGGVGLTDYEQLRYYADAPPDAVSARLVLLKTGSSQTESYAYLTHPLLAQMTAPSGALSQTYAVLDPRPALSLKDRMSWNVYNKAGQLAMMLNSFGNGSASTDEELAVVEYRYDGAGRQTETIAYATPLDSTKADLLRRAGTEVQALEGKLVIEGGTITLASDMADRRTRNYYSRDGLLIGQIDADNYYTQNTYNGSGLLISSIRYGNQLTSIPSDGSLPKPGTAIIEVGQNRTTRYYYNGRKQLIGMLDAENYYTAYQYDASGNKLQETRSARTVTANSSPNKPPSSIPTDPEDRTTQYYYDLTNLLVRTVESPVNVVTTYTYDKAGNLLTTVRAAGTTDARETRKQYDKAGRVIKELTAEGVKAILGGMAEATAWSTYGITHQYDQDGRRIATIEPTGSSSTSGYKTVFYYDKAGRLTLSINALGEITQYSYNAFGQQTQVRQVGARLTQNAIDALTGGLATPGSATAVAIAAAITLDAGSATTTQYDRAGRVYKTGDALDKFTTYSRDVFGDLRWVQRPNIGGQISYTQFEYDHRGLLKLTYDLASDTGEARHRLTQYNAFGQLMYSANASPVDGVTPEKMKWHTYDRLGRSFQVYDAGSNAIWVTTVYDAFDRLHTEYDQYGRVTTYSYDSANRTLTIKTPEGTSASFQTTQAFDRHGQIVSITNENGAYTQYVYNADGHLTDTIVKAGSTATAELSHDKTFYDRAGRVQKQTTLQGRHTTFIYDKAGRVFQQTDVDVNGTAGYMQEYRYDALGRAIWKKDGLGTWTKTTFDANGRVTATEINPSSVPTTQPVNALTITMTSNGVAGDDTSIKTTFEYDERGQLRFLTEGAGSTNPKKTEYKYDGLGRRRFEIVDPTGLQLTTEYVYDGSNNVVGRIVKGETAAKNQVTRYVYDSGNRINFQIDGTGAITQTEYDNIGNISRVTAYAKRIDLGTVALTDTKASDVTSRLGAVDASVDHVTRYVYDSDSRLILAVDALGYGTRNEYDNAGNVVARIRYFNTIPALAVATEEDRVSFSIDMAVIDGTNGNPGIVDAARDRVDQYIYDGMGRVVGQVDAEGGYTLTEYDLANGQIKTTRYVNAVVYPSTITGSQKKNRLAPNTPPAFGTANPIEPANITVPTLRKSVAEEPRQDVVTTTYLDAFGRTTRTVDGEGYQVSYAYNALGQVTIRMDEGGNNTHNVYDRAGRLVYTSDAKGTIVQTKYDKAGRTIQTSRHDEAAWKDTGVSIGPDGVLAYKLGTDFLSTDTVTVTGSFKTDTGVKAKIALGNQSGTAQTVQELTSDLSQGIDGWQTFSLTFQPGNGVETWIKLMGATALQGKDIQVLFDDLSVTRTRGTNTTSMLSDSFYSTDMEAPLTGYTVTGSVSRIEYVYDTDYGVNEYKFMTSLVAVSSVTAYAYDGAGRLVEETRAKGRPEEATTRYVLNKLGQREKTIDPRGVEAAEGTSQWAKDLRMNKLGYEAVPTLQADRETMLSQFTTKQKFDAQGRVTESTDAFNVTVYTDYDAFGNTVRIKDPNGNYGYFVFDKLNQATWQVDPLGHATETKYDGLGAVKEIIKYSGQVEHLDLMFNSTTSTTVAPLSTESAAAYLLKEPLKDAKTVIAHDRVGRQTRITDAQGYYESMAYDALGNKISYTAKSNTAAIQSGGITTYEYDRRGLMVREVQPERAPADWTVTLTGSVDGYSTYPGNPYRYAVYNIARSLSIKMPAGMEAGTYEVEILIPPVLGTASNTPSVTQSPIIATTSGLLNYTLPTQQVNLAFAATTGVMLDITINVYRSVGGQRAETLLTTKLSQKATRPEQLVNGTLMTSGSGPFITNAYEYDARGNLSKKKEGVNLAEERVTIFKYDSLNRQIAKVNQLTEVYSITSLTDNGFMNAPGLITNGGTFSTAGARAVTHTLAGLTGDAAISIAPTSGDDGSVATFGLTSVLDGTLTWGLYCTDDFATIIYNDQLQIGFGTSYALGDILSVTYDGQKVLFLKNGVEFFRLNETTANRLYGHLDLNSADGVIAVNQLRFGTNAEVQAPTPAAINSAPTEISRYDAANNLIEKIDADGARHLYYYDALNRKVAELSPLGTLTTFGYDDAGHLINQKIFGDAVTLPPLAGGTAPQPPNPSNCREMQYVVDAAGRVIEHISMRQTVATTIAGGSYSVQQLDVSTTVEYDAAGNVVKETDPRGNTTWRYYDKTGKKILEIDAERAVTQWEYDAFGRPFRETKFDTKLPAVLPTEVGPLSTSLNPAVLLDKVNLRGADTRVTNINYDKLGRIKSESRMGVNWTEIDAGTGALTEHVDALVGTTFAYNGLGLVISRTESDNGLTSYAYDKMGRLIKTTAPEAQYAVNASGTFATVRPVTDYRYDGLGQMIEQIERNTANTVGASDHVLKQTFASGHKASETTNGVTQRFRYDVAGRLTQVYAKRLDFDGQQYTDYTDIGYDLEGREILRKTYTVKSGDIAFTRLDEVSHQTVYDAYGDLVAKGTNGFQHDRIDYDAAGRVWRTNSGTENGQVKVYYYDASGNNAIELTSSTKNLFSSDVLADRSAQAVSTLLQSNNAYPTVNVYDGMNRLTAAYTPPPNSSALEVFDLTSIEFDGGAVTANLSFNILKDYGSHQISYITPSFTLPETYGNGVWEVVYDITTVGQWIASGPVSGTLTANTDAKIVSGGQLGVLYALSDPIELNAKIYRNLGSAGRILMTTINIPNILTTRTSTLTLPKTMYIKGVPKDTTKVNLSYKATNSSTWNPVLELPLMKNSDGIDVPGWYTFDWQTRQLNGDYNFTFEALNGTVKVAGGQGTLAFGTAPELKQYKVDTTAATDNAVNVRPFTKTTIDFAGGPVSVELTYVDRDNFRRSTFGSRTTDWWWDVTPKFTLPDTKAFGPGRWQIDYDVVDNRSDGGGTVYVPADSTTAIGSVIRSAVGGGTFKAKIYRIIDGYGRVAFGEFSFTYGGSSSPVTTTNSPKYLEFKGLPVNTEAVKLLYRTATSNTNAPYDHEVYLPKLALDGGATVSGWHVFDWVAAGLQAGQQYDFKFEAQDSSTNKLMAGSGRITLGTPPTVTYTPEAPPTGSPSNAKFVEAVNAAQGYVSSLSKLLTYDAFGQIKTSEDALHNITKYDYDKLGNVILKTDPKVNATGENGFEIKDSTPTTQYKYDSKGRLVQVWDAEDHWTRYASGTIQGENVLLSEFYQEQGAVKRYGYSVFGDQVYIKDEANRVTWATFDQDHQIIAIDRPGRADEEYKYDSRGNRIGTYLAPDAQLQRQWVKSYYDGQGRLKATVTAMGIRTEYSYVWLAGSAAWRTITTSAGMGTMYDDVDVFGRKLWHMDYGLHAFTYRYNDAGLLVSQTSLNSDSAPDTITASEKSALVKTGQDIQFFYYANGQLKDMVDKAQRVWTHYQYDAMGRRTLEAHARVTAGSSISMATNWEYLQNAVATYDALGRVTRIKDQTTTTSFEYDKVGNRRLVEAIYINPANGQEVSTQDWYTYDTRNRLNISQGSMGYSNGTANTGVVARGSNAADMTKKIVIGTNGVFVNYDAANQRTSAQYGYDLHVEDYKYNAEGNLNEVGIQEMTNGTHGERKKIVTKVLDARGNAGLVESWGNGSDRDYVTVAAYNSSAPRYWHVIDRKEKIYDADNRVISEIQTYDTVDYRRYIGDVYVEYFGMMPQYEDDFTAPQAIGKAYMAKYVYDYENADLKNQSRYLGTFVLGGGQNTLSSTVDLVTSYVYDKWDFKKVKEARFQAYNPNVQGWAPGISKYEYNQNGHLRQVSDEAYAGGARIISYANDAEGRILRRVDTAPGRSSYTYQNLIFNGRQIGAVASDNTTPSPVRQDYGQVLMDLNAGKKTGADAISSADFDQNFEAINPGYPASSPTTYTVASTGETLGRIAQSIWGDSSLWYLIAEANGLTASQSTPLSSGLQLSLPNKVINIHNNSSTVRPYDPALALGDTDPTIPPPPPPPVKRKKASFLFQVISIVIIVAVAVLTDGAGVSVAEAALAAMATSFAMQNIAVMQDYQDDISWSSVAVAGITAGIANGAGQYVENAAWLKDVSDTARFAAKVVTAAAANATSQHISVTLGLQEKFSWLNVAASAAAAGIQASIEGISGFSQLGGTGFEGNVLRGSIKGIASGWASSIARHQKADWAVIAAEGIGSGIGTGLGREIKLGMKEKFGSTLGDVVVEKIAESDAITGVKLKPGMTESWGPQYQFENVRLPPDTSLTGGQQVSLPNAGYVAPQLQTWNREAYKNNELIESAQFQVAVPNAEIGTYYPDSDVTAYPVRSSEIEARDLSPTRSGSDPASSADWLAEAAAGAQSYYRQQQEQATSPASFVLAKFGRLNSEVFYGGLEGARGIYHLLTDAQARSDAVDRVTYLAANPNVVINGAIDSAIDFYNLPADQKADALYKGVVGSLASAGVGRAGTAVGSLTLKGTTRALSAAVPYLDDAVFDISKRLGMAPGVTSWDEKQFFSNPVVANSERAFSRIVPGGGLQAHESAGGHLLLKHVGQSEGALMNRLASEPRISGSSSFYNRATAEDAVSQILDANQAKISDWLSGSGGRLRLDHSLSNPVGISVTRGAPGAVDVSSGRVILVRDPSMQPGYKILTGFPTQP